MKMLIVYVETGTEIQQTLLCFHADTEPCFGYQTIFADKLIPNSVGSIIKPHTKCSKSHSLTNDLLKKKCLCFTETSTIHNMITRSWR